MFTKQINSLNHAERISEHTFQLGVKSWERISYDASFPVLGKRPHLHCPLCRLPMLSFLSLLSAGEPISMEKHRRNHKECSHCPTIDQSGSLRLLLGFCLFSRSSDGGPCSCVIVRETPLPGTESHSFLLLLPFQGLEELPFCNYFLFLLLELIFK